MWIQTGVTVRKRYTPCHRSRRVPGHWAESRFVTSGHGPVSCLSSTDEFRQTPDKCSMSVRSNRRVPIKQNRSMTKVQRVSNSSSDVCSDEISGQWRFTHRLRRAPSADSDYPPATHLPHSHVMLSSHRRQDKSVIRRPLIGSSSVGYRNHHTIISGSSADDRSDSGQNLYEREGSFRSLFAITRMSSDEVQMKMSYQCPTSVLLLSDYLPVAPITLLLVTYQHYICVTNWNVSNQYPTKLVGSEKSTFRPASGQRPASVEGGHQVGLWPL